MRRIKMKLFVITCVCTVVASVRVPVWPILEKDSPYGKHEQLYFGAEKTGSVSSAAPHLHSSNNAEKGTHNNRHDNPKSSLQAVPGSTWIPALQQVDTAFANNQKEIIPSVFEFYTKHPKKYDSQEKPYENPLLKNYRDDKLHEPNLPQITTSKMQYSASSEHEIPKDIPTKPNYPGEGAWAKKGIKHRPYISTQHHTKLEETNTKPDGYEIFEEGEANFKQHQNKFNENSQNFPQITTQRSNEQQVDDDEEEVEEEESNSDFVPIKTYAQVRRTENEQHLPNLEYDPRLREVIKDSKILTVYSEEGYEDSAYDHEGHEKNAENSEGHAEFDKNASEIKKPPKKLQDYSKEIAEDAAKIAEKYFSDENNEKSKELSDVEAAGTDKFDSRLPKKKFDNSKSILLPKTRKFRTISSHTHNRQKRFTNDFPQINVDTDFIDTIKTDLNTNKKENAPEKYPYYKMKSGINKNSPLRYAEDMNNIPKKLHGRMAFYEQADKIQCAEVESDVNPVPGRIQNADSAEAAENSKTPKTPRLGSLGDKIDCFKNKYFGENPLDSPIFNEELIDQPDSIFEEFDHLKEIPVIKIKTKEAKEYFQENVANLKKAGSQTPVEHGDYNKQQDYVYDESLENYKTIDDESTGEQSTRKSDQIQLIDIKSDLVRPSTTTTIENNNNFEVKVPARLGKAFNNDRTDASEDMPNKTDDIQQVGDENAEEIVAELPENLPLRMRRRRVKPPRFANPMVHVFDINRYIPPLVTPAPMYNLYTTVRPKFKTISEVYYKDDIKPNEQLNVFADIINNIKNSSHDPNPSASNYVEPISVKLYPEQQKTSTVRKTSYKRKPRPKTTTEMYEPNIETENMLQTYQYTSTVRPALIKKVNGKTSLQLYNEFIAQLKEDERNKREDEQMKQFYKDMIKDDDRIFVKTALKRRRVPAPIKEDVSVDQEEKYEEVSGLIPPSYNENKRKRAEPPLLQSTADADTINIFYVPGMRPPPKMRPITYAEYNLLSLNKVRRRANYPQRRRSRRDTNSRSYAGISRSSERAEKPNEKEEEEDDYVPHRHKTYHYDENTHMIVYDKKPEELEEVEEDEEEEEEYAGLIPIKEKLPISRKKTTTEGPPTTPGIDFSIDRKKDFNYLEFVNKLKSAENYVIIPDPTTTERGTETTTIEPALPTEKTTPPAFIGILAKLRSDSSYKEITDKPAKTIATTPEPDEENEDEEEEILEGVRNSPGGDHNFQLATPNLQIFDISEYLPKVKNYSPRTSIDVSKYKNIERTPPRHNISSKYSEDEEGPVGSTSTKQETTAEESSYENISRNGAETTKAEEKNYQTIQRPNVVAEVEVEQKLEEYTSTSTAAPESTTSKRRVLARGRKRPTTTQKPTTTTSSEEATSRTSTPRVKSRRPTRIYPRKHNVRIRTTESPEINEDVSKERIQRRVHFENEQQTIPVNHKEIYTPITVAENSVELLELRRETLSATPRVITPEIVNRFNVTKQESLITTTLNPDVEVFASFDASKKHGGNYRHKEDTKNEATRSNNNFIPPEVYEVENSDNLKRLVDAVPKPFAFYTDPRLPNKINLLKEQRVQANQAEIIDEVKKNNDEDYAYDDEVTIRFEKIKNVPTKKPVFIKDPNKRLYFYAPL